MFYLVHVLIPLCAVLGWCTFLSYSVLYLAFCTFDGVFFICIVSGVAIFCTIFVACRKVQSQEQYWRLNVYTVCVRVCI